MPVRWNARRRPRRSCGQIAEPKNRREWEHYALASPGAIRGPSFSRCSATFPRVHVHGSGVWGNRYWCDWLAGVRRVVVMRGGAGRAERRMDRIPPLYGPGNPRRLPESRPAGYGTDTIPSRPVDVDVLLAVAFDAPVLLDHRDVVGVLGGDQPVQVRPHRQQGIEHNRDTGPGRLGRSSGCLYAEAVYLDRTKRSSSAMRESARLVTATRRDHDPAVRRYKISAGEVAASVYQDGGALLYI